MRVQPTFFIILTIMATKVYKLNQKKNSAIFTLSANDGKLQASYTFKDGNVLMRQPARCTLHNEFYQALLESSDLFKRGIIKLERTINDEEKKVEQFSTPDKKQEDSVSSPDQAIAYVFDHWGIVVKNGKQAAKIASQKGVEFPNLKEKTTDK